MNGRSSLVVLTLCAILSAVGILASNMGYKANYPLYKTTPGISKSGSHWISIPYIPQAGMTDSLSVLQDIAGKSGKPWGNIISVSKFLESTDTLCVYTGPPPGGTPCSNFPLVPGEGLLVQMSNSSNYVIAGSHNPTLAISLDARGPSSRSGMNQVALPYNIAARTALELIEDIEGVNAPPFTKVVSVSKYLTATDTLQVFTGRMGSPGRNFNILPGESYRIQMSATVSYVPSHY